MGRDMSGFRVNQYPGLALIIARAKNSGAGRPDLEAIKTNPASIVDAFKREAHNAMTLKQLDLGQPT